MLYYHFLWHTRQLASLITPENEAVIYQLIQLKSSTLNTTVLQVNGTCNHIHLVAALPTTLSVAAYIGQLKGYVATRYNKQRSKAATALYWERGYSAFTISLKQLPYHMEYVKNQKIHHSHGAIIPFYEGA